MPVNHPTTNRKLCEELWEISLLLTGCLNAQGDVAAPSLPTAMVLDESKHNDYHWKRKSTDKFGYELPLTEPVYKDIDRT